MTMPARALARALAAALLGTGAALALASCGSSGQGLIPSANAGPLQADFEAVVQEAESGDGSCAGTEAALVRTERDYGTLPAGVDAGLRRRLSEGISKLRDDALSTCAQPHPRATVTTTTKATAPPKTTTTPTVPQTTPTQTTSTPTTPAPSPEGGGTPAPGSGGEESGAGSGDQGPGGSSPGNGQGNGEGPAGGPGVGIPGGGR